MTNRTDVALSIAVPLLIWAACAAVGCVIAYWIGPTVADMLGVSVWFARVMLCSAAVVLAAKAIK